MVTILIMRKIEKMIYKTNKKKIKKNEKEYYDEKKTGNILK